jgi:hypothetical protein
MGVPDANGHVFSAAEEILVLFFGAYFFRGRKNIAIKEGGNWGLN